MLPDFVEPMLAKSGPAFDSDDHLFEVKWDGTRGLCFVDQRGYRLLNRRRKNLKPGYPELAGLEALPPGTVLDGELVVLRDGQPSFRDMLVREQSQSPRRSAQLARSLPASYVVFDVLFAAGRPLLERPLEERRLVLEELLSTPPPRLALSEAIRGSGMHLFGEVVRRGLEGIVAKRRSSAYEPGRRTGAWTKCKPRRRMHCVILGYVPVEPGRTGDTGFKSLFLGTEEAGRLVCVGRVGGGFRRSLREQLWPLLRARLRTEPVVAVPFPRRVG